MDYEDNLKKEIVRTMAYLYNRRLVCSLGGNVSARLSGANHFWITPSQHFKGKLRTTDLVKCTLEGEVIEGEPKPSVEIPFHSVIYRKRPDVNAVVHGHNPVATGIGIAGVKIKPITPEALLFLGEVPIAPYKMVGTEDLAKAVAEHIVDHNVIILENHGVIGVGRSLLEAKFRVELLEETSIMMLVAHLFGRIKEISHP